MGYRQEAPELNPQATVPTAEAPPSPAVAEVAPADSAPVAAPATTRPVDPPTASVEPEVTEE